MTLPTDRLAALTKRLAGEGDYVLSALCEVANAAQAYADNMDTRGGPFTGVELQEALWQATRVLDAALAEPRKDDDLSGVRKRMAWAWKHMNTGDRLTSVANNAKNQSSLVRALCELASAVYAARDILEDIAYARPRGNSENTGIVWEAVWRALDAVLKETQADG